ncbi:hypothetical protein [Bacillus cytotoxicus]|uniref:hypothetical protein n=1 Tax=Bacillus cytotoxicus TaxID=580165 RepID=UPI0035CA401B
MLHNLSVEELIEINDFFNSSTRITITYFIDNTVLLELYEDSVVEEFILSKRDLIVVLRNFYVEDICDIVLSGVKGCINIRVDKDIEDYPVEITVEDGYKYYCNIQELNYIKGIISNQRKKFDIK